MPKPLDHDEIFAIISQRARALHIFLERGLSNQGQIPTPEQVLSHLQSMLERAAEAIPQKASNVIEGEVVTEGEVELEKGLDK